MELLSEYIENLNDFNDPENMVLSQTYSFEYVYSPGSIVSYRARCANKEDDFALMYVLESNVSSHELCIIDMYYGNMINFKKVDK